MTMMQDDFAARLVRAAALQLGSQHLTHRYAEEWLSNLPPRDRYQRWRYALSLFLRGAQATRWALRHQAADSRCSALTAKVRTGACLLLIPAGVLLLAGYYGSGPWKIVEGDSSIGWFLMTGTLTALSLSYRGARWAVACGILLSLIQTWAGTSFIQGGGPLVGMWSQPGFRQSQSVAWQAMESAGCLAAAFGGIATAFRYRTPLLVRIFAGLGASALFAGARTILTIPIVTVRACPLSWDSSSCHGPGNMLIIGPNYIRDQFYCPLFGWIPTGSSGAGITVATEEILTAMVWGAETVLLSALIAIALRLAVLAISLIRASEAPHQDLRPDAS
jgi:hypothetical protein